MYDPPGANAGQQWLEVTNLGATPVDLSDWRLSEGGTNHKLSVTGGVSVLAAGGSLIIAENPDNFIAAFPQYAGALLKSAFTLKSKSGDTVVLKDASLASVDTVSYTPAAGAAGDGNTLHRVGSSLVAGAPDPGVYSAHPPAPLGGTSTHTGTSATSKAAPKAVTAGTAAPAASSPRAAPQAAAPAAAALSTETNPLITWGAGAVGAVLMLAAALMWLEPQFLRRRGAGTVPSADEFEIEE